ncbi:class I SAM-dependent methyltransferase [Aquisalimonas lutea]|uniref:class I SAM-dependent methyltransferase n=1 Tax=Aquisalimonas lutea TaxID=1327750 RepID=UPI0025B38DF7|nr:class I SAM-dependent methyltransferase [Aquisalimonas lutea]MDN3517763.1 class I SAM-dependent methyltransferase [Aquisalimonas lutea]
MDAADQAAAYAAADFEEPNSRFVAFFADAVGAPAGPVLDLGCGPGDIVLRLARRYPGVEVHGLDGAEAMLAHARQALGREPELASRVRFLQGTLPDGPLPRSDYAAVTSNSLLHHLHRPADLWATMRRAAAPGAAVLVMDLFRPGSREDAEAIVATYGAGEPDVLRRDFFNSLLAAFTPDEVRRQLREAGLPGLQVETVSDRHLLVHGRLP